MGAAAGVGQFVPCEGQSSGFDWPAGHEPGDPGENAAEWLEAIGAINDAEYAALLVRHCAGRGYGPARVREKLYEKGIPRELWDEALETMPDPAEQIDRFLQEKLRGRTPDEKEKKRLSDALLRRGFGWGDVKAGLNRLGAELYEE